LPPEKLYSTSPGPKTTNGGRPIFVEKKAPLVETQARIPAKKGLFARTFNAPVATSAACPNYFLRTFKLLLFALSIGVCVPSLR
jgi:hypothetical protein